MASIYTDAGQVWVVDVIDATATPGTHYIGWGTGAGTAGGTGTTLFTEATEARSSATKSQPATDTNQWVATITADGPKTITNAGVFTATTAGTMLVKGDFTGIALDANDAIEFTITLQQKDASE